VGTSVLGEQTLRLRPGRYRVVASITPAYVRVFGLSAAQASRTLRLVVKDGHTTRPDAVAGRAAPGPPTGSRRQTNNVALRRIVLGGRPGARTVECRRSA
jgi:hypothetical protein